MLLAAVLPLPWWHPLRRREASLISASRTVQSLTKGHPLGSSLRRQKEGANPRVPAPWAPRQDHLDAEIGPCPEHCRVVEPAPQQAHMSQHGSAWPQSPEAKVLNRKSSALNPQPKPQALHQVWGLLCLLPWSLIPFTRGPSKCMLDCVNTLLNWSQTELVPNLQFVAWHSMARQSRAVQNRVEESRTEQNRARREQHRSEQSRRTEQNRA